MKSMEIYYLFFSLLVLKVCADSFKGSCIPSLQTCRQCAYLAFTCLPYSGFGYDEVGCANLVGTKSKNPRATVYGPDGSGICDSYSCDGFIQYSAYMTLTRLSCSTGCRYISLTMMEDTIVSTEEFPTRKDIVSEAKCTTYCIQEASAFGAPCTVSYNAIKQTCIIYTSCASDGCTVVSGESGWKVFVVKCSNSECNSLHHPENGVVTTNGLFEGDQATYECNEGFQVVGSINRTCLSDGNWTGNGSSCEPVNCGPLRSPVNGTIHVTNTTYLSEAVYECNAGFAPISTIRTCEANGFWDGTDVECIPVECPVLRNPINGSVSISGRPHYDEVATYICNAGYSLNGNDTRVCMVNGNWSETEPTCEALNSTVNSTVTLPVISSNVLGIGSTVNVPTNSSTANIPGIGSTVNIPENVSTVNEPAIGSTVNIPEMGSTVNEPAIGSTVNKPTIGSTQSIPAISSTVNALAVTSTLTLPRYKPERIFILPCLCNRIRSFENMTVAQIIDQLVSNMKIDRKKTSVSRNKLRSKQDSRKSTKIIGVAGTVLILITCILPILFDVLTFLKLAPT